MNRQFIATGGADGKVMVWTADGKDLLACLTGHKDGITAVQFSNNDQHIISTSYDGTIQVRDWHSGQILYQNVCVSHCTPDAAGGRDPLRHPIVLSPDHSILLFNQEHFSTEEEADGLLLSRSAIQILSLRTFRDSFQILRRREYGGASRWDDLEIAVDSSMRWLAFTDEYVATNGDWVRFTQVRNMQSGGQSLSLPFIDGSFSGQDEYTGTTGYQIFRVNLGLKASTELAMRTELGYRLLGNGYYVTQLQPGLFQFYRYMDSFPSAERIPIYPEPVENWQKPDSTDSHTPPAASGFAGRTLLYDALKDRFYHPQIPDSFLTYGFQPQASWMLRGTGMLMAGNMYMPPHGGLYVYELNRFADLQIPQAAQGIHCLEPGQTGRDSYRSLYLDYQVGGMNPTGTGLTNLVWNTNLLSEGLEWKGEQSNQVRNVSPAQEDMYTGYGFTYVSEKKQYLFNGVAGGSLDVMEMKDGRYHYGVLPADRLQDMYYSVWVTALSADEETLFVRNYENLWKLNWKTGSLQPTDEKEAYAKGNRRLELENAEYPVHATSSTDSTVLIEWYTDTLRISQSGKPLVFIPAEFRLQNNFSITADRRWVIGTCEDGAVLWYDVKRHRHSFTKYYFANGGWVILSEDNSRRIDADAATLALLKSLNPGRITNRKSGKTGAWLVVPKLEKKLRKGR
ncbi:MAG: hypothetical protein JNL57_10310 [Bacteroidetes bacterium]|nr:hypothetical protein [Bacteroidota bacterium]